MDPNAPNVTESCSRSILATPMQRARPGRRSRSRTTTWSQKCAHGGERTMTGSAQDRIGMAEAGEGASGRKQTRVGHVLGSWASATHVYLKPRVASVASRSGKEQRHPSTCKCEADGRDGRNPARESAVVVRERGLPRPSFSRSPAAERRPRTGSDGLAVGKCRRMCAQKGLISQSVPCLLSLHCTIVPRAPVLAMRNRDMRGCL